MKKALYLLLCINSNNDKISIATGPSRESSIQLQSRRNSLVAPPSVDGLAKASNSDLNLASDRESPRSSQRRGSLTGNSVRQSRSESVMAQRPLVSALLVGEHLRKEKAKQSRTGDVERQKSKIETLGPKPESTLGLDQKNVRSHNKRPHTKNTIKNAPQKIGPTLVVRPLIFLGLGFSLIGFW